MVDLDEPAAAFEGGFFCTCLLIVLLLCNLHILCRPIILLAVCHNFYHEFSLLLRLSSSLFLGGDHIQLALKLSQTYIKVGNRWWLEHEIGTTTENSDMKSAMLLYDTPPVLPSPAHHCQHGHDPLISSLLKTSPPSQNLNPCPCQTGQIPPTTSSSHFLWIFHGPMLHWSLLCYIFINIQYNSLWLSLCYD